jgi:hypothetical protein
VSSLKERGRVILAPLLHRIKDYPVHDGSGEVGVTHLGDMSEEGVELLVGVEDAILSEVVGRPDGANALAPRLFIK